MTRRRPGFTKRPGQAKPLDPSSVRDFVKELKSSSTCLTSSPYRELSLRIHGLICAKCGREFEGQNRNRLTVHHKDGNPRNNPPDGSNWENLCVDCHEDQHSRGLLGDHVRGK